MAPPIRICFVCLGNICRSPTAEGIFRHLAREAGLDPAFEIDSAGTAAYHVSEPPDARSVAAAARQGIAVAGRARQFEAADFAERDLVVAMDADNVAALRTLAAGDAGHLAKIVLLRAFDPEAGAGAEVPDPYYGGPDGFDHVVAVCRAAAQGLLQSMRGAHGL